MMYEDDQQNEQRVGDEVELNSDLFESDNDDDDI